MRLLLYDRDGAETPEGIAATLSRVMDFPTVHAYTDGASHGRRGAGGWGAVLLAGGDVRELSGSEPDTTNQRMEVTAACEALEALLEPSEVTVFSDSSYLINCMRRRWYEAWRRDGWTNSRGQSVANRDLWKRLLLAAEPHRVTWRKVKGHRKSEGLHKFGNDRADELAVAAKLSRTKPTQAPD